MQQLGNEEKVRPKKAYLIYKLETRVSIEIIVNPNTQMEYREEAKCVYQYEYNPNIYLFSVDLPPNQMLMQQNTVIFEITYQPQMLMAVSYYSDRMSFSKDDDLTYYFMFGLKFMKNERNMLYKDPPGEPVENIVEQLTTFYHYIFSNYIYIQEKLNKMGRSNEIKIYIGMAFNQIADLVTIFKSQRISGGNQNSGFFGSVKNVNDLMTFVDDVVMSHLNQKMNPEVILILTGLFGIFQYDHFTSKEFPSKNAKILLNNVIELKPEILSYIEKVSKPVIANGLFVLISNAIKEGFGNYINLVKTKHISLIFDGENEFYTKVNELIRRCGTGIKENIHYNDAKKLFLEFYTDKNPQLKIDSKLQNGIFRNIGIISYSKEILLQTIFEFNNDKLIDVEKLKLLKEELKKKKWFFENEDNFANNIQKIQNLIEINNNELKDEFKNLLYEASNNVKYLTTLLRLNNFNLEKFDLNLFKKSFMTIYEFTLEDFTILIQDLSKFPEKLKKEIFDSTFYEKTKSTLKKVTLPFKENEEMLKTLLLNEEIFPTGSLEYVKDFMKNKPSLEDLIFIIRDLVYPQKNKNSEKKFIDILLIIKNYLVNSYVDIADLVKNFFTLIKQIHTDEEFKIWFTDEIWKTITQKYSSEVFIWVSSLFSESFEQNEIVINSYRKYINNIIESIPTESNVMYEKVNSFISAISYLSNAENSTEKVVYSNNKTTENMIIHLLDYLLKHSDPNKISNNYLYENPSKDTFWYRLLNSFGKCTQKLFSHGYMTNVKQLIQGTLNDVKNGTTTIKDFILISKQNATQRDAMIKYFASENISEILDKQLCILGENLKTLSELETFFNSYSLYIENYEEYSNYIKETKLNFKATEFKDFKIRNDLKENVSKIQGINKWSETVMFKNIFAIEFELKSASEKKTKFHIDNIIQFCQKSESEVKNILNNILLKEDFSKLSLSVTKKYFRYLEDFEKESRIIDEMIGLDNKQKNILYSILKTFCEISNFIKFSNSLIKLNATFNFSKNNTNIYAEFLDLLNNTDSSFDKIFSSSKRLTEIRTKYLSKRDIENILFELGEDKELTYFLLYTPEEDIRNMVDAVDEHGDSFIRVQTIRDLLIIGSFIKSLNLKDFLTESENRNHLTEEEFIDRIHNSFKRTNYTNIDVLMNSCSKQFTGIKHLHNELSNREEASKLKAQEISKHSTFEFVFTNGVYEVIIKYGKSQKKINFRDLGDLRDRVLLLIYNEKEKSTVQEGEVNTSTSVENLILMSFIKIVELTEKILFILNDIYHNGYPKIQTSVISMEEGDYSTFEKNLNEISCLNTKWNEDLKEAYAKYYPLTYYNGNQFWELESLFTKIKSKSYPESSLEKENGFSLLKFANPNISISEVITLLGNSGNLNSNIEAKDRIFYLGELICLIINPSKNGVKQIPNLRKVNLNLKGGHIIYSSPTNLRIYTYLISIHLSIDSALPSANSIFYCRKDTTFHELIAFLYRFKHSQTPRLFSMIKIENLSFELQNFLAEQINKLSKNKSIIGYLSMICCDMNSFLHTGFVENSQVYLMRDFDILDEMVVSNILQNLNLNTHVVRSDDTGAGKTYHIRSKFNDDTMVYVDFPIMDSIDVYRINERLYKLNSINENKTKFFHITLNGIIDDFELLDYIIFSLAIIGCVKHEVNVSFRDNKCPIYLEVSNTFNDYLYHSISILPLLPNETMIIAQDNLENISSKDMKDVKDPLQVITNYLYNYDKEYLNDTDIVPEVAMNTKIFSKEDCLSYIKKYFVKGNNQITFRQIQIFISVLNDQLVKFSNNYFFSCENLGYINDDNLRDIRQRIMQCLLIMTEEFTTRSIKSARDSQNQTVFKLKRSQSREDFNDEEKKIDEINSLSNILSWSSSNHLIIMFHEDGMCVTPVYREAAKVNEAVRELAESQRQTLEDYQVFSHFELLEKLTNIVGRQFDLEALAKRQDYILTADNFLKMLLIIIRARCNVPIVIMGETGCGKTSLVRFLATEIMQEGFEIINFHAGVKEQHIIEKMNEVISRAEILKVTDNKVWIFLDEINTCDCMGLISELICQKTMLGQKLPENIVFIAACNPYKIRKNVSNEVGLVKQRIATRLVYTVHPLPDALIDYVWDYGSLSENEERLYIGNILGHISGEIKKISIDAVCKSQIFIRKCEDKFSVSLRDVARFKILHEWFYKILHEKNEEKTNTNNSKYVSHGIKFSGKLMISRKALILSVILCYYNRISKNQDRIDYKKMISNLVDIKESDLEDMINEEQRDLITRMELPPAIAINKALLENVFTLMVCVINKIPLFICGKPGCSKSLSIQLLVSNLRGADSNDNFFKKLPRILAIPYQGSESSTSEGIARIFEKASSVLNNTHDNSILPLIVFDEIGLAEISKNNPLKILHSLLEPEKAEIAFVGISNWRLDASKMNRAVYLARPDPDLEDLENTALSIFDYYIKEPRFDEKSLMKALARTYFEFKANQTKHGNPDFHGTRDFYSLIKGVTKEFNLHYSNYNEMKYKIIKDSLCRNFGGLKDSIPTTLKLFSQITNVDLTSENFETLNVMNLVKDNLSDKDSRFLLLFTNGESASYILDNYLKSGLKERQFMIGSEFEMDKDKDEHSFRLLSDIILYMESGNSIIMKNLDQVYGSLYDLFNQNFMIVGQKKNCRIALGSTNNPMCFVKDSFHCVVLVDINNLHKMDPPFLNRFEKQILTFDSVLNTRQNIIVKELNKWIGAITNLNKEKEPGFSRSESRGFGRSQSIVIKNESSQMEKEEMIITYNAEFSPSLVLSHFNAELTNEEIIEKCKEDVLSMSSVSLIVYSVLSQMYQNSRDEVMKVHKIYFENQCHDSLTQYLNNKKANRLIVYTYSNILEEVVLGYSAIFTLNCAEIKSEKEFDQRFKTYLKEDGYSTMIIKFDAIKEKKHISMIKFKIDKLLNEFKKSKPDAEKNIIMIIYLSRKSGNNSVSKLESHFLSNWSQVMIDCLNGGQISELKNLLDLSTLQIVKRNLDKKWIAEIIFNIYLKFSFSTYNTSDMSLVKLYMTESIHKIESDDEIFGIIFNKCLEYLEDKELEDWKIKICCDNKILSKSMNTFTAIKSVIESVIEEPLLKIIHFIESESALNSYFYMNNEEKAKIFKSIWKEQFEKKNINEIYSYNVTGSLNVNCLFNLEFPFSKGDIFEISHALKESIEKVRMMENAAYNQNTDPELSNSFIQEIEKIRKIVKSAKLYKILSHSEYQERALESAYISDIINYFLTVELKKEYRWKNTLDIIIQKTVGFDIENLEHIYIFLWKNIKILDSMFTTFNSLCSNFGNTQALFAPVVIENILQNDNLYDKRLSKNMNDINLRKEIQAVTFTNIFNTMSKLLLSQLNNVNSNLSSFGIIINTFISSMMNYSLEVKNIPDAFHILIVINEYLKILASIYKNDYAAISKLVKGLFFNQFNQVDQVEENTNLNNVVKLEDTRNKMIIEEEIINTDIGGDNSIKNIKKTNVNLDFITEDSSLNSTFVKFEHISLKDFTILNNILNKIDEEYENLCIRQQNPDNFIKMAFVNSIKKGIISSKLTMFENIIIAECDFETKVMIIHNILKDDELCQNSSMIFYHLYMPITNKIQNLGEIRTSKFSTVINGYLTQNKISFNSVLCSFFSDFFRKFLTSPQKNEYTFYLNINKLNFESLFKLCQEKNTIYDRLVGYAGVKHYLDIYGRYLADEKLEKDEGVLAFYNNSLESTEHFVEVLRNYTLKSMAADFGGTANTLVNIDYQKLKINWVNNKLFENNDNALGIEPNLPEFEKINKEYNLFFVSLLNEDSEENISKLKNLILNSVTRLELKFILIQFFINKIWLNFTHPKYISSYTYQFVKKLFDKIKADIKTHLGEIVLNFIQNLVNNFPNNKNLSISPTTDTNRIGMFTLTMQMLNMLLSFNRELCVGKLFFNEKGELYKNLNHLMTSYLPGGFVEYQDENLLVMMKHIDENYEIYGTQIGLYECECGFLYTIGDCTRPYYVSQCPSCQGKIGGTGHVLMTGHKNLINADNRNENNRKKWVIDYLGKKLKNNPGYVAKMADELSMYYSIRGLGSIGFRFFNYFIHSVMYLLIECGAYEDKSLSNVINIKGLKIVPSDYLFKHMITDIAKLTELIKSKEWYIFMHVVFNEFLVLSREQFRFDSAIEREKFEIAFNSKIVAPKLDKLAGEITEFKMFFNNDKKLNYLSIINENFCEDEIKTLSNFELFRIFRFTRLGFWEDLKTEFINKKVPFQLLKLLIEKFDEVTYLSECLNPILVFTNYMLKHCNYRFTRAECKEKKIREVITNSTAENLFLEFALAWEKIAYHCTQWQCKSMPVLTKINLDLPLSFILVDDRELGYGMYIAAAFQYLGKIQNEVLEAIVYLIQENNNYGIWGNMDTLKYPIQKISPHEIIMYQTDKDYIKILTETFSKFYDVFNSNYGQGGIVEYNFEKIEGELAFKLLTNKKFLDYENLEKIQYKFELLSIQGRYSNLLTDIKSKLDQVNLNDEDLKDLKKCLDKLESQNVAYIHSLFSSLEIVLCSVRYQNYIENTTISNYISKMSGSEKISPLFNENPVLNSLKLSNIISVYSTVEEMLFKYMVEFISPEYNQPLDEKVIFRINEFIDNSEKCENIGKYPQSKLLLSVIRRFITRCLVSTIEAKFPIKEYLMRLDFWNLDTKEEVIDNFYFDFPDEILIANTLSMYYLIQERVFESNSESSHDDQGKLDAMRQEFFKKKNKLN